MNAQLQKYLRDIEKAMAEHGGIRTGFLDAAEALFHIRYDNIYKEDYPDDTFRTFCARPEVKLPGKYKNNLGLKLAQIYRILIADKKLDKHAVIKLGYAKAYDLAMYLKHHSVNPAIKHILKQAEEGKAINQKELAWMLKGGQNSIGRCRHPEMKIALICMGCKKVVDYTIMHGKDAERLFRRLPHNRISKLRS